ncbi:MAG: HAD-IA family hydrolase, partial [Candidatus Omnitrophica bacterium]|nr:HAD-IA family hydrolase [Candidatus Omnitrophota bacterium]
GAKFTELALDEVLRVPYVAGAREFLESRRQDYLFFIASGTPEDELDLVIERRGMQSYFDGVYGSPRTKTEIIEMILSEQNLKRQEVVFIGDANSDRIAAREAQVEFIFREYGDGGEEEDRWVLPDLLSLDNTMRDIEELKRSVAS